MSVASIMEAAPKLAEEWASQREDRQNRTKADPADYQSLRELGFNLMAVPVQFGGYWEDLSRSGRSLCTVLRMLAKGDPSITLSSSMHQGVLASWRVPSVPDPFNEGFQQQRKEVFSTVTDGCWWGTIVSEPGSGGDTGLTRAGCVPEGDGLLKYRLSGQKHFGSGSGLTSFMTTRAVPEGETAPDLFFMEVRNHPWDGSTGLKLAAEWRGHGMKSTNSHAFEFTDFPATRIAWPGHQAELMNNNSSLGGISFTSVIMGVIDAAMEYSRERLKANLARGSRLRSLQQVDWTMAEQEAWLIDQAWEGAMRVVDTGTQDRRVMLMCKENVARLSESVLNRLCRIAGGNSYTWYSPLGAWFEDVRALGYLRPPWALAYDNLYNWSVES